MNSRPRTSFIRTGTAALGLVLVTALAGCADNATVSAKGSSSASDAGSATAAPVKVTVTDTECKVETTQVPGGQVNFSITNKGTLPNEFEVLAKDKLTIVSEKESIGPGSTVTLTTALTEGDYFTACKPNMVGAFVGDAPFTVTPSNAGPVSKETQALEDKATSKYKEYVQQQVGYLQPATQEFVAAYLAGDTEKAKALFPQARKYYERIEPVAEAFGIKEAGDLDASLDLRIQDLSADAGKSVTDPDVIAKWTGWHRIEAELFSDNPAYDFPNFDDKRAVANQLVTDTQTLNDLVNGKIKGAKGDFDVTLEDVTTGANGLMEEVFKTKIVGEEETFSHTDLEDFQANLDGARVAWNDVKPLVEKKDPALVKEIDDKFAAVQKTLDPYKDGKDSDGDPTYVDYSTIASVQKEAGEAPVDSNYTEPQRKFADSVNALSESLAKIESLILH